MNMAIFDHLYSFADDGESNLMLLLWVTALHFIVDCSYCIFYKLKVCGHSHQASLLVPFFQ